MKKSLSLFLTLALSFTLVACGASPSSSIPASTQPESTSTSSSESQTSSTSPAISQDRAGNPITLPENINGIVSLAASTTTILIDLGLADKLVAVDTYSTIPAELEGKVIRLDMMEPDLEQITALKPDILFTTPLSSEGGADKFTPLRNGGLCVAEIPTAASLAAIWEDIQFIAACTGTSAEGEAMLSAAKTELATLAALLKTTTERPNVLFEVSPVPYLYTTGGSTYLNELIELAGGTNVFAAEKDFVSITEESAVAAQPEFIFTSEVFAPTPVEDILGRSGWENVPAVSSKNVYYIDANASSQPTQHVVEVVRSMMEYMHPSLFA